MTPVAGETASLSYVVGCEGEACRGQSFQLGFMVDGHLIETRTVTASEASQSLIFWEPNCGGTVQLVIDPDNLLSETDETDNTWSGTVSCIERPETEKPDLSISGVFMDPWPIAEGERITFTYSVANGGRFGSVATGPFTVGLRVGGVIVGSNRYAGIPCTSDTRDLPHGTITWTAHCGGPIELVVDTENEVDEGDETNNVYNGLGTVRPLECVPARVDLTVMLFQVSDGNPEIQAGRTKAYIADIWAFRGDPRNVRVRCGIVGGEVLYDEVLSSLGALDEVRRGERISFSTALCPAGRTFRLYCEVDPDNEIAESDETDNREEYAVTTVADPRYTCP
jgi:subtilase family serine protease